MIDAKSSNYFRPTKVQNPQVPAKEHCVVSTTLEMKLYYATRFPLYCHHDMARPMHCIDCLEKF